MSQACQACQVSNRLDRPRGLAPLMSPHFHLRLDRTGYERCADLLAAGGMTFTESRRHVWEWSRWSPLVTDIHGTLSSSRGTFECCLRGGTAYELRITVEWH
jgi:hypothetical protein